MELKEGGYGKIETSLEEIENLALDGIFAHGDQRPRFRQICLEVKKLRQALQEAVILNPEVQTGAAPRDAA